MSRVLAERVSEVYNPCPPDAIDAQELRDGTWLLRVAASNFQRFGQIAEAAVFPTRSTLTWGSLCSGSEGAAFVTEAINVAMKAAGCKCVLQHMFSCEVVPDKRCWIRAVSERGKATIQKIEGIQGVSACGDALDGECQDDDSDNDDDAAVCANATAVLGGRRPGCGSEDQEAEAQEPPASRCSPDAAEMPCIFCDITLMGERMCECKMHAGKCYVPRVDLLLVGTSCKDVSRANPNKAKHKNVLQQTASRGGSAQTFHGLLAYLDKQRPTLVIFENVDALLEDSSSSSGSSNMQVLISEFANRGYQAQATICEASKFGLPCRRRRLYVFFVQMTGNNLVDFAKRPVDRCFAAFRQFLATCMRDAPSLEEVLLNDDHEAVLAELATRRTRASEPMSSVGQAEWPEAHMKFAEALQMMWTQPAGEHLQSNPWYHTLGTRERNALPLLQAQMPRRLSMVRDLSQSIGRANAATWQEDTRQHVCPTLLAKMTLWLERSSDGSKARLLLGREALSLQGFPVYAFLEVLGSCAFGADEEKGPQAGSAQTETKASCAAAAPTKPGGRPASQLQGPLAGKVDRPPAGFPSEGLMADLAGNMMSLPVLMAVAQSALACIQWKDIEVSTPVPLDDDIASACAAVELLSSAPLQESERADTASRGSFKKLRRG